MHQACVIYQRKQVFLSKGSSCIHSFFFTNIEYKLSCYILFHLYSYLLIEIEIILFFSFYIFDIE